MYPLSDSHERLLSSWPRSILILFQISPLTLHFHVHQRELAHLFVHQASVCPDDRSGRWSIINAACFKDISLHFVSDYAPASLIGHICRIFFIVLVVLGLLFLNNLSSRVTLLRLLVLIRLGLIELRLISPLLTALLQAQPYLLFGGQFNSIDLRIPLDCIVVIAGPELFLLNPFSMYF